MNKRFLIITCVLFIVAIITWLLAGNTPSQQNSLYAKQLPMVINDWVGRDIDVDDKILRILETDDVLMRYYTKKGIPSVLMSIVYASNNIGVKGVRATITQAIRTKIKPLVIQADKTVQTDLLVQVIDQAKLAGIKNVSIATVNE